MAKALPTLITHTLAVLAIAALKISSDRPQTDRDWLIVLGMVSSSILLLNGTLVSATHSFAARDERSRRFIESFSARLNSALDESALNPARNDSKGFEERALKAEE